ncbi:MAG: M28 family peptidase [Sphingomonadales bacterium]|nr:M28 family peptidase [Sphingomonadales bacterium]
MNGFAAATRRIGIVLAVLAAVHAPVAAARNREVDAVAAELLADMKILASDDFQGRMPGSDGEAKTLRWLGKQWFDAGLVSGTNDPGHAWFAPVTLVAREPAGSTVQFQRAKRSVTLAPAEAIALTSGRRSLIEGAPLLFVGRGERALPSRAELAGRVAVLLDGRAGQSGSDGTASGAVVQGSDRQNALLAAGASAVLTVLDGSRGIDSVAARRKRQGYALAGEALGGDLEAFITAAAMERLLGGSAGTPSKLPALESEADRADFAPRLLDLSASIEATTRETRILTHNLIGKLPGRRPDAGAVLLLAHWDHFGTCAQPPAEHLICNGAIDNASGVAALTAIARRLGKSPYAGGIALDRDVYFLATTGEELGLLGAEAFAENPPLPLKRIVAAFNLDTIAIAPAGTALGLVGKGMTPLDPGIAQVARAEKRKLSDSTDPNIYIRRQDAWALMRHDVPAVMVTSAYGDIARLERFFDTDYHRPSDVMKPQIELGGAAQDVLFHVALVRWFADARRWPSPR